MRLASQTQRQVIVPIVLELTRHSRDERSVGELRPVLVVQPLELLTPVEEVMHGLPLAGFEL
jgi:hypothetical protein